MKKLLMIILSALMLVSLCACGGSDEYVVANGMKLAGKDAGNNAVDFNFTYPEDWSIIRNDGVVEIQYDCDESAMYQRFATVSVLTFSLKDANQTALSYWTEYEEQLKGVYTDYKAPEKIIELNEEGKYLDDTPAIRAMYSGKLNNETYSCDQVIACRYGKVYLITMVVPSEHYEKVTTVMDTVIKDFDFID